MVFSVFFKEKVLPMVTAPPNPTSKVRFGPVPNRIFGSAQSPTERPLLSYPSHLCYNKFDYTLIQIRSEPHERYIFMDDHYR